MLVLTIGLLGVAGMVSSTIASGSKARIMNIENMLACEKLDSLNRWPSSDASADANIQAGGSLTGPAVCATGDAYCDQVTMNEATGADFETQTQFVNGVATTTTIVHTSAGCVDTPANCGVTAPAAGSGSMFTRRWLITSNPVVSAVGGGAGVTVQGYRRITVIVSMNDVASTTPVTFQMSVVRP